MGTFVYVMASEDKIDVGGLVGGGHRHLLVDRRIVLEPFEGLAFPEPAAVRLELRAADGLLEIGGTIDVEYRGECDRCLGGVVRGLHLDVMERLDPAESARRDPFGESNVLAGSRLDVADLVAQLVCSAVPFGLLCTPNCKGLCQVCGENKNQGACACVPENGDERGELKVEDPAQ